MVDTCTPPSVCMGWKGYLLVDGNVMPYDSADFSEKKQTLEPNDIHGGGVGTTHGAFHSMINSAEGPITYEGSIRGKVYTGSSGFGLAFKEILKRAMGGSATNTSLRECGFDGDHPLIISWGGCGLRGEKAGRFPAASTGRASIDTLTLTGTSGELISWDANLLASSMGDVSTPVPTTTDFSFESGSDLGTGTPVPWFAASWSFSAIGEADFEDKVTDWTLTIKNNLVPKWSFNGERSPADIFTGMMEVSGSFKYYSTSGSFAELTHGSTGTLVLGAGSAAPITLFMPYIVIKDRPIAVAGVNDVTMRTANFIGLGASSGGSIYLT